MSIVINNKIILFLTFLACYTININSTSEYALYKLKSKEEQILKEIETLKKEILFSYHLTQNFNAVYRKPHQVGPVAGNVFAAIYNVTEQGRFILAYGLLPITLPLTAIYSATKWLSKKNNNNETKIEKLELILQKIQDSIRETEQEISQQESMNFK